MNKKTLMYGGGAVALVLIFLYLRSRQGAASSAPSDTIGTPQDQGASDYANLAGALQGVGAQEQSDISGLTGQLAGLSGQEQSDIAGLQAAMVNAQGTATTVAPVDSGNSPEVASGAELAAVMAGQKSLAKELAAIQKSIKAKNRTTTNGHANNHHPAGTAGHAVGSRSHAPKTGTVGARFTFTPPRTHAQPPHVAPTHQAATKPKAKAKPPAKKRR